MVSLTTRLSRHAILLPCVTRQKWIRRRQVAWLLVLISLFLFLAAVICSKAPTADQPVERKQSFIEFTVEEVNEKVLSLDCV